MRFANPIEVECLSFVHEGKTFFVSTEITHELAKEDVGIGSYEYWGSKGYDSDEQYFSLIEKAFFADTYIYEGTNPEPIAEPSKALVEAAHEAAFTHTIDKAQESVSE